jgi:imidazolonepropionase-like amidohydrolase
MTKKQEIESLFEMITKNAAIAMNLSDHKIAIGAIANMVILENQNITECIRNHSQPTYVISNGVVLDFKALRKNI